MPKRLFIAASSSRTRKADTTSTPPQRLAGRLAEADPLSVAFLFEATRGGAQVLHAGVDCLAQLSVLAGQFGAIYRSARTFRTAAR